MARILMLVGDFVEDYEVIVPFQALQIVGHEVDAVCPGKQAGDKVRTAVHDFEDRPTPRMVTIFRQCDLRRVEPEIMTRSSSRWAGAGVSAPDEQVLAIVRYFADAQKPIARPATVRDPTAAGVVRAGAFAPFAPLKSAAGTSRTSGSSRRSPIATS
jgi:protease I